MPNPRQLQAARQYEAVAHMARALAQVHEDIAKILRSEHEYAPLELAGERSARIMETLGDILNGMDAVDESQDGWLDAVFHEAHRMWPSREEQT